MKIDSEIDYVKMTTNPKISFTTINYTSKETIINSMSNRFGHNLFLNWCILDYGDEISYSSRYTSWSKRNQMHGPEIKFNY